METAVARPIHDFETRTIARRRFVPRAMSVAVCTAARAVASVVRVGVAPATIRQFTRTTQHAGES